MKHENGPLLLDHSGSHLCLDSLSHVVVVLLHNLDMRQYFGSTGYSSRTFPAMNINVFIRSPIA